MYRGGPVLKLTTESGGVMAELEVDDELLPLCLPLGFAEKEFADCVLLPP